jgi:hypothetical protein
MEIREKKIKIHRKLLFFSTKFYKYFNKITKKTTKNQPSATAAGSSSGNFRGAIPVEHWRAWPLAVRPYWAE